MEKDTADVLRATAKPRKALLIMSLIWFAVVRLYQDFYPAVRISLLQEITISLGPPMVIIILVVIWYRIFKYKPAK